MTVRAARADDGSVLVLAREEVEAYLGPTSAVHAPCRCYPRFRGPHQPVHVVDATSARLRALVSGQISPDEVLLTYFCQRCKGVVQLTTASLGIGQP